MIIDEIEHRPCAAAICIVQPEKVIMNMYDTADSFCAKYKSNCKTDSSRIHKKEWCLQVVMIG